LTDKIVIVFKTKELPTPQTQILFAHTAGLPVIPTDAQDKLQDHEAEGALRDMQWQFRPYPLQI
jgi:hypothetical protein